MSVPHHCNFGVRQGPLPVLSMANYKQSELLKLSPGKVCLLIHCSVLGLHVLHPLSQSASAPSPHDDRHLHVLLLGIHTALGNISCKKKKDKTSISPNLVLGCSYPLTHAPSGSIAGEFFFIIGVFLQYTNALL